jgi:F-box domain
MLKYFHQVEKHIEENTMGNWSELPYDLLGLITSFLPITDAHRFSVVCREWNYVFKETNFLTGHEITKKRTFYNKSEK